MSLENSVNEGQRSITARKSVMYPRIQDVSRIVNRLPDPHRIRRMGTICSVADIHEKQAEREARAERLRQAVEAAGYISKDGKISPTAAAQANGWKVPAFKHHCSGRNGYSPEDARKYAAGKGFKKAKVTANWLLNAEGDPPTPYDHMPHPINVSSANPGQVRKRAVIKPRVANGVDLTNMDNAIKRLIETYGWAYVFDAVVSFQPETAEVFPPARSKATS